MTPAARVEARWIAQVRAGNTAAARRGCEADLRSPDRAIAAAAETCLASVLLLEAGRGRAIPEETFDAALVRLRHARELTPQDAATHHRVLEVLLRTGRHEDVPGEIARGVSLAPRDGCGAWSDAVDALMAEERLELALEAARIAAAPCPAHGPLAAQLGALLMLLDRDVEAGPHLVRAVELQPSDPVARWHLARHFQLTGQVDRAAESFAQWSELETDDERRADFSCVYASFLERDRRDLVRACRLQASYCPPDRRSACDVLGISGAP